MIHFENRMQELRCRMDDAGIDTTLITDDDNICYLTGYCDYLYMEFVRPMILVVRRSGGSLLIAPVVDLTTAKDKARVDRISARNDGMDGEWRGLLSGIVAGVRSIAIELDRMPWSVRDCVSKLLGSDKPINATPILAGMRMNKTDEELRLVRHAGQVARR